MCFGSAFDKECVVEFYSIFVSIVIDIYCGKSSENNQKEGHYRYMI